MSHSTTHRPVLCATAASKPWTTTATSNSPSSRTPLMSTRWTWTSTTPKGSSTSSKYFTTLSPGCRRTRTTSTRSSSQRNTWTPGTSSSCPRQQQWHETTNDHEHQRDNPRHRDTRRVRRPRPHRRTRERRKSRKQQPRVVLRQPRKDHHRLVVVPDSVQQIGRAHDNTGTRTRHDRPAHRATREGNHGRPTRGRLRHHQPAPKPEEQPTNRDGSARPREGTGQHTKTPRCCRHRQRARAGSRER